MNRSLFRTVLREAMLLFLAACFALGSAIASLPMHAHGSAEAGWQALLAGAPCVSSASDHRVSDASAEVNGAAQTGLPQADPCLHCLCAPSAAVPPSAPPALGAVWVGEFAASADRALEAPRSSTNGPPPARGPPLTI